MLFPAVVTIVLSSFVAAQNYGGGPTTPTSTTPAAAAPVPSAPANTAGRMNINVAPGNFSFSPPSIMAPNGTIVTFYFPSSSVMHSVTQSSFENPCTYLAATSNTSAGFDSGLTSGTQFTIVITDESQPIWYHCKQVTHCGTSGMVGSINAPTNGTNTFAAFQAAAMKIGSSEVAETSAGFATGGVNGVASAGPSNTATGATSSTTPSSAMRVGISVGAILLGAAGMIALA